VSWGGCQAGSGGSNLVVVRQVWPLLAGGLSLTSILPKRQSLKVGKAFSPGVFLLVKINPLTHLEPSVKTVVTGGSLLDCVLGYLGWLLLWFATLNYRRVRTGGRVGIQLITPSSLPRISLAAAGLVCVPPLFWSRAHPPGCRRHLSTPLPQVPAKAGLTPAAEIIKPT